MKQIRHINAQLNDMNFKKFTNSVNARLQNISAHLSRLYKDGGWYI